jgi:hypothetical protein
MFSFIAVISLSSNFGAEFKGLRQGRSPLGPPQKINRIHSFYLETCLPEITKSYFIFLVIIRNKNSNNNKTKTKQKRQKNNCRNIATPNHTRSVISHTNYTNPLKQVKVTLRLSVSQSISLGVKPNLGLMTRYLLLFDSYGLVIV